MPIFVISTIKQKNYAIFPLIEDADLLGGFRSVPLQANLTDATIPLSYRKEGMFVWTNDTGKLWRLNVDLASWTELAFGGGAGDALVDTRPTSSNVTVGDPVSIDAAGSFLPALAGVGGPHEVYGIALSTVVAPAPVDVVTSGVVTNPAWVLTPGAVYYLGLAGGVTSTPPDLEMVVGAALVRIGLARTSTSMLVRVQHIAVS